MSLSISSRSPFKMPISPLQILLLIQLEEGAKYGYEMLKHLEEEFTDIWTPKTGTVYPALHSLKRKKYVETRDKDGTEFYYITEEGRAIFDLLLKHIVESLDFSVVYIKVIFKWLSMERKQGAIKLVKEVSKREKRLSDSILKGFIENIDTDIKDPFLRQIKQITTTRLEKINNLLGE